MEKRMFDRVKYDKGDIVIRKNKIDNEESKIVDRSEELTNIDNFTYMIIYFENDDSPYVSAEYEPFNEDERKEYYKLWNNAKALLNKGKTKVKKSTVKSRVNKTKSKVHRFKVKDNEKD